MRYSIILAGALLFCAPAFAKEMVAFPGAEGFGQYASGGRGGAVYHVTSLADDGSEGTLRWANDQPGPKTILFDVDGTIHLRQKLHFNDDITLAGESAPGDGVCLAGYPVMLGSNNIVRYMRFRLGNDNVANEHAGTFDALGCDGKHDVIIDHCSVSWSIDECCSVLGNDRTTLQWCIVDQSLVNAGHAKGAHGYGGNWGGDHASFHHNLLAHHTSRAPRLGPNPRTQEREYMDMRCNLIYNYGGEGCYGGEAMKVNIVNNYYQPGPGTKPGLHLQRIAKPGIRTQSYVDRFKRFAPMLHVWGEYFVEGNVNPMDSAVTADNWQHGVIDQINIDPHTLDGLWNDSIAEAIHLREPLPIEPTTTHDALTARELVLAHAGASLHRDSHDQQIVRDAREGLASATGEGLDPGFINTPWDNRPADAPADWNPWPTLRQGEPRVDTDGDGLPDDWELAHGLDPADPADGARLTPSGYSNLELWLHSLCEK